MRTTLLRHALLTLSILGAGAGVGDAAPAPRAPVGMYRAVQLDRKPLPAVERLRATPGYHHYVKLDGAVVTLRADGKFIASFRYWHHHLADGAAVPSSPVMSETYRGTWSVRGATVVFVPTVSRGRRQPDPIVGTLDGQQLHVSYRLRDGVTMRAVRLDLQRDAAW